LAREDDVVFAVEDPERKPAGRPDFAAGAISAPRRACAANGNPAAPNSRIQDPIVAEPRALLSTAAL
jgi:hypothetical protein